MANKIIPGIAILFFLTFCTRTGDPPENIFFENMNSPVKVSFRMKDHNIWGASVIQAEDGKYYMFASRWPKKLTMRAWATNSEIVLASADKPEGPYKFRQVVFPPRGPRYFDGMMTHNPSIHYHNGKYVLFYLGLTYDFERPVDTVPTREMYERAWNNKRIGVAVSESVHGPWKRLKDPLLEPREDHWDAAIISNPAPVIHDDGSVFLIYKSAPCGYPERNTHYAMYFGAAGADHYLGPYERISENNRVTLENVSADVEDPCVWYDGEYYQMLAKCMDESVTGEKGTGFFAYSRDGIYWQLPERPASYSMTLRWADGSTVKMKRMERAQVFLQNGKPSHVFYACIDPDGEIYNIVKPFKTP